jgi:predicted phosphoribosyltransferase
MFRDRKDAGRKLVSALMKYKDKDVLVLAIPCGGVEVAFEVAKRLNAELDILVSRKLPLPENPEAGFGAIAEDGPIFINRWAASHLSSETIEQIKKQQIQEIRRRIDVLRSGKPLTSINNKTIILVDDGIAMGSTMRAAIMLCRSKGAKKIIVASPVAGSVTVREISQLVDEIVILEEAIFFQAVAQVYVNWHDVSDSEVIQIMNTWRKRKTPKC